MTSIAKPGPNDPPRVLVLFDCDDTVLNSEMIAMPAAIKILYQDFGAARLVSVLGDEHLPKDVDMSKAEEVLFDRLVKSWAGRHFEAMVKECHTKLNAALPPSQQLPPLTDKVIGEYNQRNANAAREGMRDVKAIPGLPELLATLSERDNHVLAIVTSSEFGTAEKPERVRVGLQAAGLLEVFDGGVYSAKTLDINNKPERDVYLYALKQLGFRPGVDVAVALEDSGSGIKSAVAAGIPVIGTVATDNLDSREAKRERAKQISDLGATTVVYRGEELLKAIDTEVTRQFQALNTDKVVALSESGIAL